MEEPRKSILETVRPTDALGRLAARSNSYRVSMLFLAVGIFFGVVILGGLIVHFVGEGTSNTSLPSVVR